MKKMRIYPMTLFTVVTLALCSMSLSSCDKEESTEPFTYSYNYMSEVISSTKTASIYADNDYKTISYPCKKMNVLQIISKQAYYYEVHSIDCLADHVKYEPGLYGSLDDWSFLGSNDYWKYNRKEKADVLSCEWNFDDKTITLSNGDIYKYEIEEIDGKQILVRLINEKCHSVLTYWSGE